MNHLSIIELIEIKKYLESRLPELRQHNQFGRPSDKVYRLQNRIKTTSDEIETRLKFIFSD